MIRFTGKLILLDIEGTVSPLAFVHQVMFPYARDRVAGYLQTHLHGALQVPAHELRQALEQLAADAGHKTLNDWLQPDGDASAVIVAEVTRLMDADVKAKGLKLLQGLIWRQGFQSGELRSTLFADVPESLAAWSAAGLELAIYSSGSVQAQKLFFAHTEAGDLTRHFRRYYDLTTGSKREPESYRVIAADTSLPPTDILFISDLVAELEAAREAGMQTSLALRPGNAAPPANDHPCLHSLAEIQLA